MRPETIKQLQENLNNLADVFGAKQPSVGAMKIWISAMSGIDEKYVLQAVVLWADHNRKFPTPAEVRADAQKLFSDHLERQAEIDRSIERNSARILDPKNAAFRDQIFKRTFDRHQEYIRQAIAHFDPKQWMWNLLNRIQDGECNPDGSQIQPCQIRHLEKVFGHPLPKYAFEMAEKNRDKYPIPDFFKLLEEEKRKSGAIQ